MARKVPESTPKLARTPRSAARKAAFLEAFARLGTIVAAAEAVGVRPEAHKKWLRNPVYAERFEEAKARFAQRLEREAIRRAVEGYEEPVFHDGKQVGTRLRYSDRLMELLLKAHLPDKYRERQEIRLTGGGDPVRVILESLPPEHLVQLAQEAEEEDGGS